MRKFRPVFIIAMIAAAYVAAAAQQNAPPPPARFDDFLGKSEKGKYQNSYFGFELSYPSNWHVVDQETSRAAIRIGTDVLKGSDQQANKMLVESTETEIVLFHASKKPLGSIGNQSLLMAVQQQPSPSVLPTMVAEATKSLLLNSPGMEVTKDTRKAMIGGREFALVDFKLNVGSQVVLVRYFVTVIRGYALTFSLSLLDGDTPSELDAILSSIRFVRN